jgi:hypothetical protein
VSSWSLLVAFELGVLAVRCPIGQLLCSLLQVIFSASALSITTQTAMQQKQSLACPRFTYRAALEASGFYTVSHTGHLDRPDPSTALYSCQKGRKLAGGR